MNDFRLNSLEAGRRGTISESSNTGETSMRPLDPAYMIGSSALLRLRRRFDVDAVTIWVGVLTILGAASAAALIGH